MVSTIGIGNDKAPAGVLGAWRSDGDTIPVIAAGTEAVGDVVARGDQGVQAIGVVQSLSALNMTQGDPATDPTTDAVAAAGSEMQVRVVGMFFLPKAAGALEDGDLMEWNGTGMEADATGAHETVGGYDSADTHALFRINIVPRAAAI